MNKIFIIIIIVMYLIMLLLEYLKYRTYKKLLKKQFKENIYEVKYKLLVEDIKNLECWWHKGGEYIIPVEVMNQIMSTIEEFDDIKQEKR